MTNAKVVDTEDVRTHIWVQVERANGSRISGLLERNERSRSISNGDLLSVYGREALWTPKVLGTKAFRVGAWRLLATNSKPVVQSTPVLTLP
jgi:hypothetical protein